MILSGGTPAASARLSSPPDTTSAPAPSLRQRRDHRLVGIRLDRVADQRRHVGEGVRRTRGSAAPASRSNSNRTACRPPARGLRDSPPRRAARRRDRRSGASRAQSMSQSSGNALFRPCRRDRPAVLVVVAAARGAGAAPRSLAASARPPARAHAAGRRVERALAAAGRQRERQRRARTITANGRSESMRHGSQSGLPKLARTIADRRWRIASARADRSSASSAHFARVPAVFSHFLACARTFFGAVPP